MKNIKKILLLIVVSFIFVGVVNAAEMALEGNVGKIANDVGGPNNSIVQTDQNNTYTYYYTLRKLDTTKFNNYMKQRYIKDNTSEGSTAYINAANEVTKYEKEFKNEILTVNSKADLDSGWTNNGSARTINIQGLTNTANAHNGYVIAVAAVKNNDNNVYIERKIMESASATTLKAIDSNSYLDSDKTQINNQPTTNTNTNTNTTTTTTTTTTTATDTTTTENPETAVSDWAIFITPISIALGSGILLRRKSHA